MPWRDSLEPLVLKNPHSTAHYQETRFLDATVPFQKALCISVPAETRLWARSRNGPIYFLIEPYKWSIDEAALWPRLNKWEPLMFEGNGIKNRNKKDGGILEFIQRRNEQPFRAKLCSAAAQQRGKWFPWHPMWASLPVLCSSGSFKEHPVITAKVNLKMSIIHMTVHHNERH